MTPSPELKQDVNEKSSMDTTSQPTPPDTRLSKLLPLFKELGPSFYAIAIGAVYISGFLVLNSNLAKFGVLDIEFVDARYFLAGASFAFYLICFYLFAGRAVLFTPKWLREDLERSNKISPGLFWLYIVFAHSQITGIYFCCLSAALFTSFAIGSAESAVFLAVLAGTFLVVYTFDVTNLDVKLPRVTEVVSIVTKVVATYVFFVYGGSGAMLTTFISYVAIFFYINLVLDGLTRYKLTTDRMTFNGIYAVVFLLGSAVVYGTSLYGQVSSKLGGARPQTVSVGLSEDARKALPNLFAASANQVLEGKLIYQTTAYTYIATSEHTIRLRSADVVALVSTPEPERSFWNEYFQQVANAPAPPNLVNTDTAQ